MARQDGTDVEPAGERGVAPQEVAAVKAAGERGVARQDMLRRDGTDVEPAGERGVARQDVPRREAVDVDRTGQRSVARQDVTDVEPAGERRLARHDVVDVDTPAGPARLHVDLPASPARLLLVLGHGAGGGVAAPDLLALARSLPAADVAVVRVEQPWRVAGRRVAPRPAVLDQAWLVAVARARELLGPSLPLVVGGRSAGARVACRTASALAAVGVLALAFPLAPPGRPAAPSRADELTAVEVPVLAVQGERDPFGGPAALPSGSVPGRIRVLPVPGADHGFAVRRGSSRGDALATVVAAVARWLAALAGDAGGE